MRKFQQPTIELRKVYVNRETGERIKPASLDRRAGDVNARVYCHNLTNGTGETWTARIFLATHEKETTKPIHAIKSWTGELDDETPLCGVNKDAPDVCLNRTIYPRAVTCQGCLEAIAALRIVCACGGTLTLDTTAEKPIEVDGEPRTVVVSVLACNSCEHVEEVLR